VQVVCGALALFDLALGTTALFHPDLLHVLMQPGIPAEGSWWIRRTAWIWLAFALAQIRAWSRPDDPARARLVAFLRAMDVPADLTWVLTARGVGLMGWVVLTTFALINLAIACVLFDAARRMSPDAAPPGPPTGV
jgi:hypothetical protein